MFSKPCGALWQPHPSCFCSATQTHLAPGAPVSLCSRLDPKPNSLALFLRFAEAYSLTTFQENNWKIISWVPVNPKRFAFCLCFWLIFWLRILTALFIVFCLLLLLKSSVPLIPRPLNWLVFAFFSLQKLPGSLSLVSEIIGEEPWSRSVFIPGLSLPGSHATTHSLVIAFSWHPSLNPRMPSPGQKPLLS